jgi:tripeptidyl-peptidase-2
MSSPNACGCITLLLSAAKATGILEGLTPVRIKRAIEQSAKLVENVDILGQGHGLIQVQRAWDLLQVQTRIKEQLGGNGNKWIDVGFAVKIDSERFTRGIYLRQPQEANTANTFRVQVDPVFKEKTPADERMDFEARLTLRSSHPWVTCPEKMHVNSGGKTVNIFVDPRSLPVGKVHVAFVRAYDDATLAAPEFGQEAAVVFEVPIVVIRPEELPAGSASWSSGDLTFGDGERIRR